MSFGTCSLPIYLIYLHTRQHFPSKYPEVTWFFLFEVSWKWDAMRDTLSARNLGGFVPNKIFVGGVPITVTEDSGGPGTDVAAKHAELGIMDEP